MPDQTTGSNEGFLDRLRKDPAMTALLGSVKDYGVAKAGSIADKAVTKASGDSGGGEDGGSGDGPLATAKTEAKKGAATGAIKGFFTGLFKKGGSGKRPTHIYETLLVGVPLDVAWDAWQEYQDWPNFAKGPEKAEQDKDGNTVAWTVKIFWSRRSFKGEIEEEIPNQRLKWKGSGAKGALSGVVTFTSMGENLTLILVVLEYRSKGMMEWIGNRWRAQGRRARLDLKHFARHATMTGYEQQFADEDGEDELSETGSAPSDSDTDTDTAPEPEPESDSVEEPGQAEEEESKPDPASEEGTQPKRPSKQPVGSKKGSGDKD